MKRIKEVIVVEGKDDTARINQAVQADTIETRGSAVSEATLKLIQRAAKKRGIIIFTDPDYSGERIRRIVTKAVPNAKHAFIPRNEAKPTRSGGSLGVEHATPENIRKALAKAYPAKVTAKSQVSEQALMHADLIGGPDAKKRRVQLCKLLNIGYVNGKQLPKRLRMFGITKSRFVAVMQKIEAEDRNAK